MYDRRFVKVPLGFILAPFWKQDGHGARITFMVFGIHVAKMHIYPWLPSLDRQVRSSEFRVIGILIAKGLVHGF